MTTKETYTEVAIRTKQHDGSFRYIKYREDGSSNTGPTIPLTVETAKKQLGLYTMSAEATVVTREVEKISTEWVELDVSDVKMLAEALHKLKCHANHVDQCDWDYGINTYSHKRFEQEAKALMEKMRGMDVEKIINIVKLIGA